MMALDALGTMSAAAAVDPQFRSFSGFHTNTAHRAAAWALPLAALIYATKHETASIVHTKHLMYRVTVDVFRGISSLSLILKAGNTKA